MNLEYQGACSQIAETTCRRIVNKEPACTWNGIFRREESTWIKRIEAVRSETRYRRDILDAVADLHDLILSKNAPSYSIETWGSRGNQIRVCSLFFNPDPRLGDVCSKAPRRTLSSGLFRVFLHFHRNKRLCRAHAVFTRYTRHVWEIDRSLPERACGFLCWYRGYGKKRSSLLTSRFDLFFSRDNIR